MQERVLGSVAHFQGPRLSGREDGPSRERLVTVLRLHGKGPAAGRRIGHPDGRVQGDAHGGVPRVDEVALQRDGAVLREGEQLSREVLRDPVPDAPDGPLGTVADPEEGFIDGVVRSARHGDGELRTAEDLVEGPDAVHDVELRRQGSLLLRAFVQGMPDAGDGKEGGDGEDEEDGMAFHVPGRSEVDFGSGRDLPSEDGEGRAEAEGGASPG